MRITKILVNLISILLFASAAYILNMAMENENSFTGSGVNAGLKFSKENSTQVENVSDPAIVGKLSRVLRYKSKNEICPITWQIGINPSLKDKNLLLSFVTSGEKCSKSLKDNLSIHSEVLAKLFHDWDAKKVIGFQISSLAALDPSMTSSARLIKYAQTSQRYTEVKNDESKLKELFPEIVNKSRALKELNSLFKNLKVKAEAISVGEVIKIDQITKEQKLQLNKVDILVEENDILFDGSRIQLQLTPLAK